MQSCDTKRRLRDTSWLQVNALIESSGQPGGADTGARRVIQGQPYNHYAKEKIMKRLNKIAVAVAVSVSVGLAATAYAHQGEDHGAQSGQHQGMMGHGQMQGSGHGNMQGMGHGMQGGKQGQGHGGSHAGQQLMTPEERTAMQEKMRNAKTPEERQQIALENRAEMQKRAAEKGITLPEHRGPHGHGGMGPNATQAPATTETR